VAGEYFRETNIKAGGWASNHNETLVRDAARAKGFKVKTNITPLARRLER
jgi:hypothetical protein